MAQIEKKQPCTSIKIPSEFADLFERLATGLREGEISDNILDLEILSQLERQYAFFLAFKNKDLFFSEKFAKTIEGLIEILQSGEIGYSVLQKDILIKLQRHFNNKAEKEEDSQQKEDRGIELTKCQQNAMRALQSFALDETKTYFKLCGYAGSGKTFLIAEYLKWLRQRQFKFIIGSPTNKALKNIRQMAREQGIKGDLNTHTVAQLLGQQPVFNESTAKEDFVTGKSEKKIDLKEYDLLIIDEYSMVNSSNFLDLREKAESAEISIVFVGDPCQLPPVGEESPAVELSDEIDQIAELIEIVRYDGEVGKIAEQIRKNPQWNHKAYPFKSTEDRSIVLLHRQKWLEKAGELFKERKDVRFIVFRNVAADGLNSFVRTQLWGKDCPPYCVGDKLIAKTPVFRKDGNTVDPNSIILNNSEECQVLEVPQLKTHCEINTQEGELRYHEVLVKTSEDNNIYLRLLTPQGEKRKKYILDLYKEERDWKSFKNLLKLFDNVPFSYAITCHKAQGSTIDYVFLDVPDLNRCRDRQKILYTALTRVKKQAFVSR